MHRIAVAVALLSLSVSAFAKETRDTLWTYQNDKVILMYDMANNGDQIAIDFSIPPRIIPAERLNQICKGEYNKLRVVAFDRVGDFGKVKWTGNTPEAFMVPAGFECEKTSDGYYILGESSPMLFRGTVRGNTEIRIPLYIAIYEKKQSYKIVSMTCQPLTITLGRLSAGGSNAVSENSRTERPIVHSGEAIEDDTDVVNALSSIDLINTLLIRETEVPFSQTLQMEIYGLRSLKNKIKDAAVLRKINDVLLQCADREQELKDAQHAAALAAQAEERALIEQQKQDAAAQQQQAEERSRIAEEQRQKRTLWMIIAGVILAVLGAIGNAVFKHFRDVQNQKSIMQMQESLARQAKHEATRRAREVTRNKAHQMVNKGRGALNKTLEDSAARHKNNKRRSI